MKPSTLDYYTRVSDARDRGPQTYGGDASIAALRAYKAHHKDARWQDVIDGTGRKRWMAGGMFRIYAIVHRSISSGRSTTVRDIATEAQVSAGYVSKVLPRLQLWGLCWVVSKRGRNGFVSFLAGLTSKIKEAQRRVTLLRWRREQRQTLEAVADLELNVSSIPFDRNRWIREALKQAEETASRTGSLPTSIYMEETFSEGFARRVREARKQLALDDPFGELDAVRPL